MWAVLSKFLLGGGISAIGSQIARIQEIRAKAENDAARIELEKLEASLRAEMARDKEKLGSILGRIPLFIAEFSASLYLAAVLIDSIWPSDWLNPLELPEWFKPQYAAALASVVGISAAERAVKFFAGRNR
jgi:hypothetical protein